MEKALGPNHPHVATTLENYAALLWETGRICEANKVEARAKAIRGKRASQAVNKTLKKTSTESRKEPQKKKRNRLLKSWD